jgi:hypothetical protein
VLTGLPEVYVLVEVLQRGFLRRHFGYACGDADPSVRREQAVLMVSYLCRRWSASRKCQTRRGHRGQCQLADDLHGCPRVNLNRTFHPTIRQVAQTVTVEDILEATSMSDLNEVGQVPNLVASLVLLLMRMTRHFALTTYVAAAL